MSAIQGGKFKPLTEYLSKSGTEEITLSFAQIEEILGIALCPSARKYSAYWHPSKTHTLPQSWIDAHYELVELTLSGEQITLRKSVR